MSYIVDGLRFEKFWHAGIYVLARKKKTKIDLRCYIRRYEDDQRLSIASNFSGDHCLAVDPSVSSEEVAVLRRVITNCNAVYGTKYNVHHKQPR